VTDPRIVIYGRPDCHLCEVAAAEVASVAAERGVGWLEVDISGDDRLEGEYADRIPVITVDGAEHATFRVDRTRLLAALDGRRID
jgi:hypothetical protein